MAERCDSLLTGILDQVMAFHSSGMGQLRPEDRLEITDALGTQTLYGKKSMSRRDAHLVGVFR